MKADVFKETLNRPFDKLRTSLVEPRVESNLALGSCYFVVNTMRLYIHVQVSVIFMQQPKQTASLIHVP